MRTRLICFLILATATSLFAQNEARFGFFAGAHKSTLYNKPDVDYGDLLPTFKGCMGVEAAYYFTVLKKLPIGFSLQMSHAGQGQNYFGYYGDSSYYYAYTRLRYNRAGLAFNISSNMRKKVAVNISVGAQYSFLSKYSDRYEHVRNNNDRFIIDIKNSDVTWRDDSTMTGTLKAPLYYQTNNELFATVGVDVHMSKHFVFNVKVRYDFGFEAVENRDINYITFNTNPKTLPQPYFSSYTVVKYRGPIAYGPFRSATNTQSLGILAGVQYRMFNENKVKWYYKP